MIFFPGTPNLILPSAATVQILAGGEAYDTDASTLFAAMSSAPDNTRKSLINDTILDLKSAGIWTELDEIWFFAAHDSQAALLGWKRYKDCTLVNSPSFTADSGFLGNGSNSYINTNFAPLTHGANYIQNDASFGFYSQTNNTGLNDMGSRAGSTSRQAIMGVRTPSNTLSVRVNIGFGDLTGASSDSSGLFVGRRSASNAQQVLRNGSTLFSNSDASDSPPQYNMYIACFNNAGTAANFTARRYAMAFVGSAMTTTQQSNLYTIVAAYLAAL